MIPLLFLQILIGTTNAQADALGLCQQVGLKAFYVFGFSDWGWNDQCLKKPSDFHPEWLTLLKKIEVIHTKTATVLQTSKSELFDNTPVVIRLENDPMGSLGSNVEAETQDLVLSEFNEFHASYFNRKIYSHELVHWLSDQPGNLLYEAKDITHHPVFIETIADWISTTVTGQVEIGLTPYAELSLPACFTDTRSKLKLSDPAYRFHYNANFEEFRSCCHSNPQTSQSIKEMCESVESSFAEVGGYAFPSGQEWQNQFDYQICASGDCDPHQFAGALLPFLMKAEKLAGKSLIVPFLKLAKTPKLTPKKALAGLRQSIPVSRRPAFDLIWQEYALDRLP